MIGKVKQKEKKQMGLKEGTEVRYVKKQLFKKSANSYIVLIMCWQCCKPFTNITLFNAPNIL